MKKLLLCFFLLFSIASYGQTIEYTICESASSYPSPECGPGRSVSEGNIELHKPGKYLLKHWCINGTDTLARDSFYVNIEALPTVSLSPHSKTVCNNDSAFALNAVPAGGLFYTAGPPTDGLEGNKFDPAKAEPGDYKVVYRYKSSSGCVNYDTASITVKDCTSGIDEPAIPYLSMYPNPARNYVELKGDLSHVSSITLTSILGQEIPVQMTGNRISLDNMPTGIFHVRVTEYNHVYTFKGIKLP